jgi:selenocysteine lyase/cysteine desulfurase
VYLNGASRSPFMRLVRKEGQRAVAEKSLPWTIPESASSADEVRRMFASLIGGRAEDVAFAPSTCSALSNVARNLALAPGEQVLVLEAQNHSNVMPWQALVARCPGARLLVVPRPPDFDWTSAVLAAIDDAERSGLPVRVVALPQCHWSDGSMLDLARVSARCEPPSGAVLEHPQRRADVPRADVPRAAGPRRSASGRGPLLVLDVTQSAGVLPVDATRLGASFVACSTHKWLMGPYGFCLLWAAPALHPGMDPTDHHDRNRAPPPGASALERERFARDGGDMLGPRGRDGYTEAFLPGARRLDQGGRPNPVGLPMLRAALRVLEAWHAPDPAAGNGRSPSPSPYPPPPTLRPPPTNRFRRSARYRFAERPRARSEAAGGGNSKFADGDVGCSTRVALYCAPRTHRIAQHARRLGFRVPPWHAPHIVGLRAPLRGEGPPVEAGRLPPLTDVVARLKRDGVSVALRMGAIRVSVHVYNTDAEVEHFCRALARAVAPVRGSDARRTSRL